MDSRKAPLMQISNKVSRIPEALSIYINQIVYTLRRQSIDVTVLSLGEAYFQIPTFSFEKLNMDVCNHYSDSRGIPELREKICLYYKNHYNVDVDPQKEILISAGSKPIIYMAMQAVLNEGDEVLIHEPAWLSYQEQLKLVGAKACFVPYTVKIDEVERYITSKTRMIIINNPNNPAGWNYTEDELKGLYEVCRPKGIYIMVDEAYSDFVIDRPFHSIAKIVPDKDGIIAINSLSKNMGISGWRIGYIISSPAVINAVLKLNQHLITCAPTVLLHYIARYFDNMIAATLPQAKLVVEKRDRIIGFLSEIGLKCLDGQSTFYIFVSIENYSESAFDLCLYLLFKYGISAVPGIAYGKSTDRFIRISIGTESDERIFRALNVIKMVIDSNEIDPLFVSSRMDFYGISEFKEINCEA